MSKFKLDRKKIEQAIFEITKMKIKYTKVDTMFICHALDDALKKIGWTFAMLLGGRSVLNNRKWRNK